MRRALLLGGLLACRTTWIPEAPQTPSDPSAGWEATLGRVVDAEGRVDFDALAAQRGDLDAYVAWVGDHDRMRRQGGARGHAFWLNAFNALALYQVLERGGPDGAQAIGGWPWGWRFFVWTAFPVGQGPPLSLWEIAHEKVLLAHQDYRSFAALSFPARSAPPLARELYRPEDLRAQLDARFSAWVHSDQGVVRDEEGMLWFSAIFRRYRHEFALFTNHADLCALAAHHAHGPRKRLLMDKAQAGCEHGWLEFDGALNAQGGAP